MIDYWMQSNGLNLKYPGEANEQYGSFRMPGKHERRDTKDRAIL